MASNVFAALLSITVILRYDFFYGGMSYSITFIHSKILVSALPISFFDTGAGQDLFVCLMSQSI